MTKPTMIMRASKVRKASEWHGSRRKEKPIHYSSDCSFIRCLLYLSVHASKHPVICGEKDENARKKYRNSKEEKINLLNELN